MIPDEPDFGNRSGINGIDVAFRRARRAKPIISRRSDDQFDSVLTCPMNLSRFCRMRSRRDTAIPSETTAR